MSEITIGQAFEYAIRNKLRVSYKGSMSVEDLYDLSIENLDSLYVSLRRQQKSVEEESLITPTRKNTELDVTLMLVKHIFQVKRDEQAARLLKKQAAEKRKRIREIIASKQDEALSQASIEDLQRMLDEEEAIE